MKAATDTQVSPAVNTTISAGADSAPEGGQS